MLFDDRDDNLGFGFDFAPPYISSPVPFTPKEEEGALGGFPIEEKIQENDILPFVTLTRKETSNLDYLMRSIRNHNRIAEDLLAADEPEKLEYLLYCSTNIYMDNILVKARSVKMLAMLMMHPAVPLTPKALVEIYWTKKTLTSHAQVKRRYKDWFLMILETKFINDARMALLYTVFSMIYAQGFIYDPRFKVGARREDLRLFAFIGLCNLRNHDHIETFLNNLQNFWPMYPDVQTPFLPSESDLVRSLLQGKNYPSTHIAGFLLADTQIKIDTPLIEVLLGPLHEDAKRALELSQPYLSQNRKQYIADQLTKYFHGVKNKISPIRFNRIAKLLGVILACIEGEKPSVESLLMVDTVAAESAIDLDTKKRRRDSEESESNCDSNPPSKRTTLEVPESPTDTTDITAYLVEPVRLHSPPMASRVDMRLVQENTQAIIDGQARKRKSTVFFK